ncbi:MAG TPA: helix-turn-helix domain-containing protein [Baekduia sp.]|nr:helix-turn-helix domain-containing protein [Baekduia sp.]
MRPPHQRSEVAALLASGMNDSAVARASGVPRATVRDWRRGGVQDEVPAATCGGCGGSEHDPLTLNRGRAARRWRPGHGPGLIYEALGLPMDMFPVMFAIPRTSGGRPGRRPARLSNRSDDIRGLFCAALDRLEIPWRRMNRWNISVAQRTAVAALDAFVERKE